MKLTKIKLKMRDGQQAVSVPRNAKFLSVGISGTGWGKTLTVTVASDDLEDVVPVEFLVMHMTFETETETDVSTEELTHIGHVVEDQYSEYHVFAI